MTFLIGVAALALFQATDRPPAEAAATMTTGGWVFLLSAWAFILFLTIWTFAKILKPKK
jgi:peptidoglycan/LPS O-acetylase OafA/YrhL